MRNKNLTGIKANADCKLPSLGLTSGRESCYEVVILYQKQKILFNIDEGGSHFETLIMFLD